MAPPRTLPYLEYAYVSVQSLMMRLTQFQTTFLNMISISYLLLKMDNSPNANRWLPLGFRLRSLKKSEKSRGLFSRPIPNTITTASLIFLQLHGRACSLPSLLNFKTKLDQTPIQGTPPASSFYRQNTTLLLSSRLWNWGIKHSEISVLQIMWTRPHSCISLL